jgi:hypothetical protein
VILNQRIDGTITRADGTKSSFALTPDGYQQWGATTAELGETVDVMRDMWDAADGSGFFAEPGQEEDADVTVTAEQRTHFTEAITAAAKACEGDSGDEEIEALWEAIDAACSILNLNRDDFVD